MTDEAHSLKKETLERLNSRECKRVLRNWLLADVDPKPAPKLPLSSFNHIAREVLNLEKSRHFYCDILGFNIVPRPHFECEGYWLFGYGLSLHLVETSDRASRKIVLQSRIKHFSGFLPRVDHIAFITSDLSAIQKILDNVRNVNIFFLIELDSFG
jgi:extradiol dioxygenase family protein